MEKISLYNSAVKTAMTNVKTWLQNNAVPKYFGKVSFSGNYEVLCYKNESDTTPVLTIQRTRVYVSINGSNTAFDHGISNAETWEYGYKCENGLSLCIHTANGAENKFGLTITKNNNGDTVIIIANTLQILSSTTTVYCLVPSLTNETLGKGKGYSMIGNFDSPVTGLLPFPVSNVSNAHTPNVFMQPFSQFSLQGLIDVDGVHYFSNGLWCIKDE